MSHTKHTAVITVTDSGVQVSALSKDARPATLVVPAHPFLHVQVNGEAVRGSVEVRPEDSIHVKLLDSPPVREMSVSVSEDEMQAELNIHYAIGVERKLQATDPSERVVLRVQERELATQMFAFQEVEQELRDRQVLLNVDWPAVTALLRSEQGGQCLCAQGILPVPGEPEHYELLAMPSQERIGITPVFPLVTVGAGTVVAKRKPAVEGSPGKTVSGRIVVVPASATKLPKLGKGVEEDDGFVRATRSGRVVLNPRLLDVAETLVFEESHHLVDGHVLFDGDIVFQHDVGEGIEVVAGGKVYVRGGVSHARISAEAGIVVSTGVVASTLRAGLKTQTLRTLHSLLPPLAAELDDLAVTVRRVESQYGTKGLPIPTGKVIAKLLEDKFDGFAKWPGLLEQWVVTHGRSAGPEWVEFLKALQEQIQPLRLTGLRNIRGLELLKDLLRTRIEWLPTEEEAKEAWIQVRNAERSDLMATGDIISTGQGFYQCQVQSQSSVRASGQPGVFVGCQIVAREFASAREVGSQAEVPTSVEVQSSKGSIEVDRVHPGTVLKAGSLIFKVEKDLSRLVWP